MKAKLISLISLQTPVSRILVIVSITIFLFVIQYQTLLSLPTISVYSRLNFPLPSIGLTRAYWYLLHGQFNAAWEMNRLVYVVAVAIIGVLTVDVLSIIRSKAN